ncbi:MAG: mandelate racemase/muconate lactonizing enzyme family protein [Acidobacteriota bacterium]
MKIKDVEAMVLRSSQDYAAPTGSEESHGVGYMLVIKVTTDNSLVGYSDVETQPHVAKAVIDAPAGGAGMIDGLRQALIGEDPFQVERLWYKMYKTSVYYGRRGVAIQAISGVDNCLWSIIGQAVKQPVCKLLGARYREKVRAYASTLFRPTPEAMKEACLGYIEQGFTAVKFGWGIFGQDPKLDVELVRAAREALGEERDLLIDPGWLVERTADECIRMVRSLEPFRPFFVEDCLPPEDYDGYARLAAAVETPIAAGEQETTHWGFRHLIERAKIDVVQPDLTRCGGLTAGRRIAHLVEDHNLSLIPHAWSSDLLTATTLQFLAFLRKAYFIEFNVSSGEISRLLAKNPITMKDGYVEIPDRPGIGIEIDDSVIEKYRVL